MPRHRCSTSHNEQVEKDELKPARLKTLCIKTCNRVRGPQWRGSHSDWIAVLAPRISSDWIAHGPGAADQLRCKAADQLAEAWADQLAALAASHSLKCAVALCAVALCAVICSLDAVALWVLVRRCGAVICWLDAVALWGAR